MIVTLLFVLLGLLALGGAIGVLLLRRPSQVVFSLGLCGLALCGLYLLLNLPFLAAVQFVLVLATSAVLMLALSLVVQSPSLLPRHVWGYAIGLLCLGVLAWDILNGKLGQSVPDILPVWAVLGDRTQALGQELLARYLVPLELLGLLILTAIVSVTHLTRGQE